MMSRAKALICQIPSIIDIRGNDTRLPDELSLRARFARGAFWSLMGALTTRGLGFISSVIIARLLGAEGFGELGMVNSTVGTFGTLAGMGMGLTALKFASELRAKDPERAGRIIGMTLTATAITGFIMAIALFLASDWLAVTTLGHPHMGIYLKIGSAIMLLSAMNGAQVSSLSGLEAYRTVMWTSIVGVAASLPITVLFVYFFGVAGAVTSAALSSVLIWCITGYALKKESSRAKIIIKWQGLLSEMSLLWKFSIPIFVGNCFSQPAIWLCHAHLVRQNNGLLQMGGYSVITQLQAFLTFLPGIVFTSALPILSSTCNKDNIDKFQKTIRLTAYGSLAMTIIPAIIIALLSKPVLAIYGKDFIIFDSALIMMLVATVIISAQSVYVRAMIAMNLPRLLLMYAMNWSVLMLVIAYYLIPIAGALGLATAFAVAVSVDLVLRYISVQRRVIKEYM